MTVESDRIGSLRAWMQRALGELVGASPEVGEGALDLRARFRELGLSSRQVLGLAAQLSQHIGRPLPATAPWLHPTPERLVAYAASLGEPSATGATAGV